MLFKKYTSLLPVIFPMTVILLTLGVFAPYYSKKSRHGDFSWQWDDRFIQDIPILTWEYYLL
jgi:hypothetical protein